MTADFPAAHSMDTEWFAVDADGRVATLWSSEDGHVPHGAARDHEIDEYLDSDSREGLYVYRYSNEGFYHGTYVRDEVPPVAPLHSHQLPAVVRKSIAATRFSEGFNETHQIQPLETMTCSSWGTPLGFLLTDGKTVRPVAGREMEYADYLGRNWRYIAETTQHDPEFTRRFLLMWEGTLAGFIEGNAPVVLPAPGQQEAFLSLAVAYREQYPDGELRFAGIDDTVEG